MHDIVSKAAQSIFAKQSATFSQFSEKTLKMTEIEQAKKEQYYVSNAYVEKVFDEISWKQDDICQRIESRLDKIQEQVEDILDIRSKELPAFWEKILFTQLRILHVGRFQVRQTEKAR